MNDFADFIVHLNKLDFTFLENKYCDQCNEGAETTETRAFKNAAN